MLWPGAASVALTLVLALRLDVIDHESQPIEVSHRLVLFWLWLAGQIVKSCLQVTRHILSPALDLSPTVVPVATGCRSDIGRTILANAITLTPGTVALDVGEHYIQVHALSRDIARDLQRGEMAGRVPDPGVCQ